MNLDETMVAQISKVAKELERQRLLKAEAVFMNRIQKEKDDKLREQKWQDKCFRDKKRLEQSGYREIIDTLVQRLNHSDLRYLALKHRLLQVLSENQHNEGITFDNITFSASTAEELPHHVALYCLWNSSRQSVLDLYYDDNDQAIVWMDLFQHTNKTILSPDQDHAVVEIINFLMTT